LSLRFGLSILAAKTSTRKFLGGGAVSRTSFRHSLFHFRFFFNPRQSCWWEKKSFWLNWKISTKK